MMDYVSAAAQGFFLSPLACDLQRLGALAATLTKESGAQGLSRRTF